MNRLCTLLLPASVENEHGHAAGNGQEQSSDLDVLPVLVFSIAGKSTKSGKILIISCKFLWYLVVAGFGWGL